MRKSEALRYRSVIEQTVQAADDNTALTVVNLHPVWCVTVIYDAGIRVQYNGTLYKCLIAHTAQKTWTPDVSPSLWAKVLIPDENIIPAWEQPDSTNAYMMGDKVTHNGTNWVSDVDNNVWEPGVYGWTEVHE